MLMIQIKRTPSCCSCFSPSPPFPHPWILKLKQANPPPRPTCALLLSFRRILPPRQPRPFPSRCCYLPLVKFIFLLIFSPVILIVVVALILPKSIFLPTVASETLDYYSLLPRRKHCPFTSPSLAFFNFSTCDQKNSAPSRHLRILLFMTSSTIETRLPR